MRISPLTIEDHWAWAELLATAFGRQPTDMVQLLTFLQALAPLIAYGAWDGAQLAAQYSCVLRRVHVPGQLEPMMVGVSINMAVHPNYRGQGLVKQVAQPVYTAVHAQGGIAGVGFSNAAGVKVDRRSKGYGYQVVGQLNSTVGWLKRPLSYQPLPLTKTWPETFAAPSLPPPARYSFVNPSAWLEQRFAHHPFRRYQFGVGADGLVVYRPFRWRGFKGVSLLTASGQDLAKLLRQWGSALWRQGVRIVHVLTSPAATLLRALKETAVCLKMPYTRSPYYLTAKQLCSETPDTLFDFNLWDCTGGDIL